jgi:TPR repeat protein
MTNALLPLIETEGLFSDVVFGSDSVFPYTTKDISNSFPETVITSQGWFTGNEKKSFTPNIELAAGKTLFQSNSVTHMSISPNKIIARVVDSKSRYNVRLTDLKSFVYWGSTNHPSYSHHDNAWCNCQQDNLCRHIAAVLMKGLSVDRNAHLAKYKAYETTKFWGHVTKLLTPHITVLALKWDQTVREDDYGNCLYDKWTVEFDYFFDNVLMKDKLFESSFTDRYLDLSKKKIIREHIEDAIKQYKTTKSENKFTPNINVDNLTGEEFEHYCADILRNSGWTVRVTKASGDQGIDLIATHGNVKAVVQCKRFSSQTVGNGAVQEISAGKQHEQADYAVVVTNSTYTRSAKQLANSTGVHLLHVSELERLAEKLGIEQENVPKNVRKSSVPANRGDRNKQTTNAEEQYELGIKHLNGDGVLQNYEEAVKMFRLASEQGLAKAQNRIGHMYDTGTGVAQDKDEAVRWFRLAAEQGHATAQFNLGLMYVEGTGVTQDDDKAVRWFRLAVKQGHARSQNTLGRMYATGRGVAQDKEEAVKWYRLAAEQGHATAQSNLGVSYATGTGVAKNEEEAAKWYRLAAAQGNADAQAKLLRLKPIETSLEKERAAKLIELATPIENNKGSGWWWK